MMNLPGFLRNGRYRVLAVTGEVVDRCPWCQAMVPHRQVVARGVLNDNTLPMSENLLLCSSCGRASIRPNFLSRLLGGVGTLILSLFMLPLFGGALYFAATFGWAVLHGTFDAVFGGLSLAGVLLTGLGFWIPFRRFIEAVRPGSVRVELPVDVDLEEEFNKPQVPSRGV